MQKKNAQIIQIAWHLFIPTLIWIQKERKKNITIMFFMFYTLSFRKKLIKHKIGTSAIRLKFGYPDDRYWNGFLNIE
ncbi:uncharacterized protein OCT59_008540 [Rhizophagus irregularis]|uniref:uncharacterized protein n=1 Tax=Rhizophagus irregularis TaxID=588596 RepID=UPI00331B0CA2|nr:hypothetical protein OCT59_008540 [Rhizophagus irregularis]